MAIIPFQGKKPASRGRGGGGSGGGRGPDGRFTARNDWWRQRHRSGKPSKFTGKTGSEQLMKAFDKFMTWVDANPIPNTKGSKRKGKIERGKRVEAEYEDAQTFIPRPVVVETWCAYLGIHPGTWKEWRKREDIGPTVLQIDSIMKGDRLTLALTGHLDGRLVNNLEGLSTKTEITGAEGGPLKISADPMDVEEWKAKFGAGDGGA